MKNIYYRNLEEQLEKVEGCDSEALLREEENNFRVKGVLLNQKAQLVREIIKLRNAFTFGIGEEFDFQKHNSFRVILDELSSITESDCDFEIVKRIIVSFDLELGVDIQFVRVLYDMKMDGQLENDYEARKGNYSFDELYAEYTQTNGMRY